MKPFLIYDFATDPICLYMRKILFSFLSVLFPSFFSGLSLYLSVDCCPSVLSCSLHDRSDPHLPVADDRPGLPQHETDRQVSTQSPNF